MKYTLIAEQEQNDDFGCYVGYGIALSGNSNIFTDKITDISPDKAFVAELVEICNEFCVEPIHLMDVIKDRLM